MKITLIGVIILAAISNRVAIITASTASAPASATETSTTGLTEHNATTTLLTTPYSTSTTLITASSPTAINSTTKLAIITLPSLSDSELCSMAVGEGLAEFYHPLITEDGLVCISDCDPSSPNYYTCNHGTCGIQSYKGPHCLCPRTDIYLYATSRCTGRILLVAIYGGVGGALGVLLISAAVLIFFLVRARRRRDDDHFYEDVK